MPSDHGGSGGHGGDGNLGWNAVGGAGGAADGAFRVLAMVLCFLVGGWIMQSRFRIQWLTHRTGRPLIVVPLAALVAVRRPCTFADGTVAVVQSPRLQ